MMQRRGLIRNKGFTLIEMFIIFVVIAVMVLLAMPWFTGNVGEAKLTQIVNDTGIADKAVENYKHQKRPIPAFKDITVDMSGYLSQGKLYDAEGQVTDTDVLTDNTFKILSKAFIRKNLTTQLTGVYLIDKNFKVYYLDVPMEAPDMESLIDDPTIAYSPNTWTNGDVTVTITYPSEATIKQYSIDSGAWLDYTVPFTITDNALIAAKGIDDEGNESNEILLDITVIDKVSPDITLIPSTTAPTNTSVSIVVEAVDTYGELDFITLPDDSTSNSDTGLYSVDSNGTYVFKAIDKAGNETVKDIEVTNISTVTPVITINSYTTTPTNSNIVVTATTDKGTLNETSHTFTENGSFTFVATDEYGNTDSETVVIDNIDKGLPSITLSQDIDTPTNGNVTITADAFDSNSGISHIERPDGSTVSGDTANYAVNTNGNYTFKAFDNAGNEISDSIEITNISTTAPVITVNPYNTSWTNLDITVSATTDIGTLNSDEHIFSNNGSFTFTATDVYGNSSSETVVISNIDKVAPTIALTQDIVVSTYGNVEITIQSNDINSGIDFITLPDNSTTSSSIATYVVSSNGNYTFKATDNAGNEKTETINISNIAVDTESPTVQFTPNGGTVAKTHSTTVQVTDNVGVISSQYQWTNSATFPGAGGWLNFASGSTLVKSTDNGNYYLHIKAIDDAGNERNATSNAFLLDNIAPNAPTLSETDGTVTITYSADSTSKEYRVGISGTWTTYSAPVVMTASDTIYARGADTAGNYSNISSRSVVIAGLECSPAGDFVFDHTTNTITGYTGTNTSIVIPDEFEVSGACYAVSHIGADAFRSKGLTSVEMGEGILTIGASSFRDNDITGALILPSTVTTIGYAAFYQNYLTSVTLSDDLSTIADFAFRSNNLTGHLTIPSEVISIGTSAFTGSIDATTGAQNKITGLTLGSSLQSIGTFTFFQNDIDGHVAIPNSVISIGESAFSGNSIDSVNIPINVTSIEESAFRRNELTSISIPEGVLSIGDFAFDENRLSGTLTIPDSVTSIGYAAFSGYMEIPGVRTNQLTGLVLGSSVQTIGEFAFDQNDLTGELVIPDSVISIGHSAFSGWMDIPDQRTNRLSSVTLGSGIQQIGSFAFYNNSLSGNLVIPNSLINIEANAFDNDTEDNDGTGILIDKVDGNQLTAITFGTGLQSIGEEAFGTNNLNGNLILPDGLTTLGPKAFLYNSITGVVLPDSLTRIEWETFRSNQISSVTLPSNLEYIGHEAFQDNYINNLVLPSTLITVDEWAFEWNNIAELIIPENVETIGMGAFFSNQLTEVEISSGVSLETHSISPTFKTAYDAGGAGLYTAPYQDGTWTKYYEEYSITYNLDGGTNNVGNPSTYTVNDTTLTLLNPTKSGYLFVGWFDAPTGGNQITSITSAQLGDKTLYARWILNASYTITYNLDGGSATNNPTTYSASNLPGTLLEDSTKAGYAFGGWYDSAVGGNRITNITDTSGGNITLYARWTLQTYTITLDGTNLAPAPSPAIPATVQFNINSGTVTLPIPNRNNRTFDRWYYDVGKTQPVVGNQIIATEHLQNFTIYGFWQ